MENNVKRGAEESNGSPPKSTMEKLQLLVKEMQVAKNLQILHKFTNLIDRTLTRWRRASLPRGWRLGAGGLRS